METSARQPNFSQEETDALVREVQSRSGRIYGHANRPPRVDDAKAAWEEQHTTREEEEEEEEQQQQVVGGEEKEGEDEDDREEEDQGEPEPVPETREGAGRGDEPATRGRRRNRVQREDQPFLDTQRAGFLMLERELGSMGTRLGSLEAQVKALQEVLQASLLPLAAGVATLQRLVQVAAEAAHKRGRPPGLTDRLQRPDPRGGGGGGGGRRRRRGVGRGETQ
ncbi:myb-related transcription factor%2C partner of profilin-like [Xyrichtys novacula]|uniref:Myb-related transcription factor, partner of profilin-like n=1 Tax=Xyrichtys novacula TaxID=13765 RepID=A0AAV1H636_XYRNO|nr:myb-related transcription factor%2C partner of profilin-like [Xyrichtys novacula]